MLTPSVHEAAEEFAIPWRGLNALWFYLPGPNKNNQMHRKSYFTGIPSSRGMPGCSSQKDAARMTLEAGVALIRAGCSVHMRSMRRPLLGLFLLALPLAYVPAWWRNGWPRGRVGSLAEAELLSQLAAVLMPSEEIGELFRSFRAPRGWGGHALQPDLAAYGVLRDRNAALFVEYDGFWRHGEREGIARDRKKNAALLASAPEGSVIVRITHTLHKPLLQEGVLWVGVDTWRQGEEQALAKVLQSALSQMATGLQQVMRPSVLQQIRLQMLSDQWTFSEDSQRFVMKAAALLGRNSSEEIASYFASEGFSAQDIQLMEMASKSYGQCIHGTLKPRIQWLLGLGLKKREVAKAVAGLPQILGYSIEQNLKPTAEWLLDLGLSKIQVAKAVAGLPQILGYSIEQNLKPTAEWLLDLGLSKIQVAKAVAGSPSVLGLSIDKNLKPTAEWLLDLGLSKIQVAKAVAGCPQILGYSIEQNLKPTVQWLLDLGLSKTQVAKAVASFPQILGLSIEQNLKPTAEWLLDFGLGTEQLAKVVARFPQVLGLSIEKNLQLKSALLRSYFPSQELVKLVASFPQVFGYRYSRLSERLSILAARNETSKLAGALTKPTDKFIDMYVRRAAPGLDLQKAEKGAG